MPSIDSYAPSMEETIHIFLTVVALLAFLLNENYFDTTEGRVAVDANRFFKLRHSDLATSNTETVPLKALITCGAAFWEEETCFVIEGFAVSALSSSGCCSMVVETFLFESGSIPRYLQPPLFHVFGRAIIKLPSLQLLTTHPAWFLIKVFSFGHSPMTLRCFSMTMNSSSESRPL